MHRLRIILEVGARGLQSGFKAASGAVKGFLSGLANMARSGGQFIDSLVQRIFFLGNVFGMVRDLAARLFNTFVGGARDIAKLTVRFKHLTGSEKAAAAVMEEIRRVGIATGQDMMQLGEAYALMAVTARDASGAFDPEKLREQADLLQFLSGLRPELAPTLITRAMAAALMGDVSRLEMVMDMPIRAMLEQKGILKEATEDLGAQAQEIGKAATYIEIGATEQAKKAADEMGYTADQIMEAVEAFTGITGAEMVEDMAEKSGIERWGVMLDDLANTLGGPVFEAINKFTGQIADMYEQDPEKFQEVAEALGKLATVGLEGLLDPLIEGLQSAAFVDGIEKATEFLKLLQTGKVDAAFELIGMEDLGTRLQEMVGSLGDVVEVLGKIAGLLLKIVGEKPKPVEAVITAADIVLPGGKGFEEVRKTGWASASADLERLMGSTASPQEIGMAVAGAIAKELTGLFSKEKIRIEVTSDSAMFDARVRQGAEDTVVRAFDEVHQNYRRRGR